jgi:hypothetical protein
MARNFLKGALGNSINALMAAAAFNFRKWMRLAELFGNYFFQAGGSVCSLLSRVFQTFACIIRKNVV